MRCQPNRDRPVYIWLKNTQSCLLCDEPSDNPQALCSACEAELPWLGEHCRICALPLLSHHLQHAFSEGLARPDLLLPVPLSGRRLRQRGFNQAGMLARWLSQGLQLTLNEHVLQRRQDTQAQQQLNAAQRLRNLRQAFALAPASQVRGLHLAIVDDVLTTGATAESIARLLRKAGAARVDVYCLARTPKPGD